MDLTSSAPPTPTDRNARRVEVWRESARYFRRLGRFCLFFSLLFLFASVFFSLILPSCLEACRPQLSWVLRTPFFYPVIPLLLFAAFEFVESSRLERRASRAEQGG